MWYLCTASRCHFFFFLHILPTLSVKTFWRWQDVSWRGAGRVSKSLLIKSGSWHVLHYRVLQRDVIDPITTWQVDVILIS